MFNMQSASIFVLGVLSVLTAVPGSVADEKCLAKFGTCQYTSNHCSGSYVSNLCNGPYNRRCCVPAFNDAKCDSQQGTCQDTTKQCVGGSYVTGLCGGPTNRRCCVPDGGAGCSAEQKRLACELFKSSNVKAATTHPSGQTDNAYAFNNLRDMCNGGKAARSSYYCTGNNCNAPGGSTCLSVNLLKYLVDLKNGGTVIINELAGACHSCTSRHYSGLAVDLHKNGRTSEFLSKCTQMGGWGLDESSHVHCQFYDGPHPNWQR